MQFFSVAQFRVGRGVNRFRSIFLYGCREPEDGMVETSLRDLFLRFVDMFIF